jgi:polysaccharide biosynthesis/export protein
MLPYNRFFMLLPFIALSSIAHASGYVIGSGDVLSIQIYNEDDLSGKYPVSDNGMVKLPLLGFVNLSGIGVVEAATELEALLKDGYLVEPNVRIEVETYASQQVQVLGAIENPGMLPIAGHTTLLDIFASVGGVQVARKSSQEVIIQRGGVEYKRVDLQSLLLLGDGNISVQGGDTIFVDEGMVVYISGKVKEAGAIPYRAGLTLTEALAEAGGPEKSASLRAVYILRDGKRIPVNVRRVMKGRTADVKLNRGDKVFVEESMW